MKLSPYINAFDNTTDYQNYITGNDSAFPNIAVITTDGTIINTKEKPVAAEFTYEPDSMSMYGTYYEVHPDPEDPDYISYEWDTDPWYQEIINVLPSITEPMTGTAWNIMFSDGNFSMSTVSGDNWTDNINLYVQPNPNAGSGGQIMFDIGLIPDGTPISSTSVIRFTFNCPAESSFDNHEDYVYAQAFDGKYIDITLQINTEEIQQ